MKYAFITSEYVIKDLYVILTLVEFIKIFAVLCR